MSKRDKTSQFDGKVALITGAASGIGAATAKLFAERGASLALTDRNLDKLKEVACDISGKTNPLLISGELTNDEDIKSIMCQTIEHFGKLDILVNNAGILESNSIETLDLEQYDRIMNINTRSMYHLTALAVPHLIKTKGNIVNLGSVTGLRAFPGVVAYCMSKAAVVQFTRCAALDLASKQVRVNSVNPGMIMTNLHKSGGMTEEQYAEFVKKSYETHAMGRPGQPEEIARGIAFLASDEASFITGVALSIDGGKHAMCPR
ncbi:uncharacterized protein LOC108904375 [Anoplophora glabripennis]|uniref:uncharacterized protein LOC108904375 n=1 Tax=Anoplophora glabripennis TaxID=217634 RepID=UPI0008745EAD|nr:uncharacterized protein LOC108904375 [Anoplophora glabripennis]